MSMVSAAAALHGVWRVAAESAPPDSAFAVEGGYDHPAPAPEAAALCRLLRDLFTPFAAPRVEPAWRVANDGAVPKLARVIYDERVFERMPILADALEEAGCDHAGLLGHCRSGEGHVRGCWALDAILGRE
jgi:hypothetical protein